MTRVLISGSKHTRHDLREFDTVDVRKNRRKSIERHVFVSGAFDIVHSGHVQFFKDAKAMGTRLTVCIPGDKVLREYKGRVPTLKAEQKLVIIGELSCVDAVVVGEDPLPLNFETHFRKMKPDILAVTDDDMFGRAKTELCIETGALYTKLPKHAEVERVSASEIVQRVKTPREVPVRVDFAGGWLDVPKYARAGEYIVNCAVSPLVSLDHFPHPPGSGIGGSAAFSILNSKDGVAAELDMGAGWQDPAVIKETGLCVWRSGPLPQLAVKTDGRMLRGRMALLDTGQRHNTVELAAKPRDFDKIAAAGRVAAEAVRANNFQDLCRAITMSYRSQLDEGMPPLEACRGVHARKYLGSGWGGYALYAFVSPVERDNFIKYRRNAMAIEPYIRAWQQA